MTKELNTTPKENQLNEGTQKTQEVKTISLDDAVKIVNRAIDSKRKELEAILNEEEPDLITLEGETSAGYRVCMMLNPKDVIEICLNYDFCTFSILESDFPQEMWEELARAVGLENVSAIDL